MALEGFLALAPDALSPLGGTPEDSEKAPALIGQLDKEKNTKNFVAAVKYLKTHPLSTGKVGVVGFCWGGAMANQVAVHSPDVVAAVPYYGAAPAAEDVPKIKASLLLHYAGVDERITVVFLPLKQPSRRHRWIIRSTCMRGLKTRSTTTPFAKVQQGCSPAGLAADYSFLKEKLKT